MGTILPGPHLKLVTAAGLWLGSQLAKHRKLHSDLLPTVGIFDRAGLSLEGVFNFCMRARERERERKKKKKKGERERRMEREKKGERPTEGKGGGGRARRRNGEIDREGGREGWMEKETNRQTGQLGHVRSPPTYYPSVPCQ